MANKINKIASMIMFLMLSGPSAAGVFYYPDILLVDVQEEENDRLWVLLEEEKISSDTIHIILAPNNGKFPEEEVRLASTSTPVVSASPVPAAGTTVSPVTSNDRRPTNRPVQSTAVTLPPRKAQLPKENVLVSNINGPQLGDRLYLRLFKQENKLELWFQRINGSFLLYKDYDICTYSGGLGPKTFEGDEKSPEGFYATQKGMLNPNSRYHLSFNIGYPNAYDKAKGYTGSFIMIHGDCKSIGCYAMTDNGIQEIYSLVRQALTSGQSQIPVHIFPFNMSDKNMAKYQDSQYYAFWQELKPAYDIFQEHRRIPSISIVNQRYRVQ